MPTQTKRSVHVLGIGKLWWPRVDTTFRRTYSVGKGPFQKEIGTLDDAEQVLLTDLGDYSEVVDYEIRFVVTRRYLKPGVVGVVCHSRERVVRPWTDEGSEDRFWEIEDGGEEC